MNPMIFKKLLLLALFSIWALFSIPALPVQAFVMGTIVDMGDESTKISFENISLEELKGLYWKGDAEKIYSDLRMIDSAFKGEVIKVPTPRRVRDYAKGKLPCHTHKCLNDVREAEISFIHTIVNAVSKKTESPINPLTAVYLVEEGLGYIFLEDDLDLKDIEKKYF